MGRGKFIVLYGINNLGKSTQAKLLVETMQKEGYKCEYLKYPIYNIEPSGIMLNDYLRKGNPLNLSPREVQIIYAINRTQQEKNLVEKLDQGINIVSEDYTGSGLGWGQAWGVEEDFLKTINSHLIKEDLAFLFDGERFTEATEAGHINETNNEMLKKSREAHLHFAKLYNWHKINANRSKEEVHAEIWAEVKKHLDKNG